MRALFHQPLVKGRQAHVARLLHLLQRVDDVVDLLVLAVDAGIHPCSAGRVGLEAPAPHLVHGELAGAAVHPLGHGLAHAARVGHPDAQADHSPGMSVSPAMGPMSVEKAMKPLNLRT